jgi:hypothetical protein
MRLIYFLLLFQLVLRFSPVEATTDLRGDSLDILHTTLHLDFTAFSARTLFARADLRIQSKVQGLSAMTFDLEGLAVDSIAIGFSSCSYFQSAKQVRVTFPAPINAADTLTLSFWYHGQPIQNPGDFGGFYWNQQYAFNIGVSFLSQPHNFGRVWFPCYDNFTERSTFSFLVKTLPQHKAFCNGTLTSQTTSSGFPVWHWQLQPPIPSYLASVAVSAYTTHYDSCVGLEGVVPVQLAAAAADSADLVASFTHLKNALSIFESRFGPYRWERLGYCVVPFNAGAMEHATNIAYMQAVVNGNTDYETLMAHELSHHWFGNLVTCDRAEEMWLNEGWAVFCEHIFLEGLKGPSAYAEAVRLNHDEVMQFAHVEDSGYHALNNVPQAFTYGPTVYKKGGDVVHTLRTYMGDSLFFTCLQSFLQDHQYSDINSAKLKHYLQQCSGLSSVHDFFRDWVEQPGFVHFRMDRVEQQGNQLLVAIRQQLRHAVQLFQGVPLDVTAWSSSGVSFTQRVIWNSSDRCASFVIPLPSGFDVAWVSLDFYEKLSDAISDNWKKIGSTGTHVFPSAKCQFLVTQVSDSALVRAEHHWIAADPFYQPIPGLHLSDNRYWTISGDFPADFKSNLRLDYNGSQNANGWLDNTLITQPEDSIVLLYRPDPLTDWTLADSFSLFKQGSATNKIGYIIAYTIRKGDYALGIWDHSRPTPVRQPDDCLISHANDFSADHFQLYPVPARQELLVEFPYSAQRIIDLQTMEGQLIRQERSTDKKISLGLRSLSAGLYMITVREGEKNTSRKFIIE